MHAKGADDGDCSTRGDNCIAAELVMCDVLQCLAHTRHDLIARHMHCQCRQHIRHDGHWKAAGIGETGIAEVAEGCSCAQHGGPVSHVRAHAAAIADASGMPTNHSTSCSGALVSSGMCVVSALDADAGAVVPAAAAEAA